jgi:hypothetical protein
VERDDDPRRRDGDVGAGADGDIDVGPCQRGASLTPSPTIATFGLRRRMSATFASTARSLARADGSDDRAVDEGEDETEDSVAHQQTDRRHLAVVGPEEAGLGDVEAVGLAVPGLVSGEV